MAYGENPAIGRSTDRDEALFVGTVIWIWDGDYVRVCKDRRGLFKCDTVLLAIGRILFRVPFEFHADLLHGWPEARKAHSAA